MSWLAEINPAIPLIFSLVLARISGLIATAPVIGIPSVPMQVRALFALALTLLITPAQLSREVATPDTAIDYALTLAGELLVGFLLGLGMQFFFSGIQLAGQLISQTSGLTLADVFNPDLNDSIPLFSQMLHTFAIAVFVTLGGHRLLIAGLLGTFETVPLGDLSEIPAVSQLLVSLTAESFALSLKIAAPCVTALLLATLVMGLISRTLPQLNILSFGFGVNALVTLGTLAVSLSTVLWILEDEIGPLVQTLLEGIQAAV